MTRSYRAGAGRAGAVIVAIILLTALTQIGGAVLIAALIAARFVPRTDRRTAAAVAFFVVFYAGASLWVLPPLASLSGRQPLACSVSEDAPVRPHGLLYCVLNRHYASPRVADMLTRLADDLSRSFPGIQVVYLDAGFPLFEGFPLPPHLSHDDGRKVDLALLYRADGEPPSATITPSPIGYWGFEQPRAGDPAPCAGRSTLLTLRWDMDWLQGLWPERTLDVSANRAMIRWLSGNGRRHGVEKVLLEPHLQRRLGVAGPMVRFQGCRAARHDDHVHVQIRPAV